METASYETTRVLVLNQIATDYNLTLDDLKKLEDIIIFKSTQVLKVERDNSPQPLETIDFDHVKSTCNYEAPDGKWVYTVPYSKVII